MSGPRGYWIARVDVVDAARYQAYALALPAVLAAHGGRILLAGGRAETAEGEARQRNVVVEFDSYDAARACWDSQDYRGVAERRRGAAIVDVVIVEGLAA